MPDSKQYNAFSDYIETWPSERVQQHIYNATEADVKQALVSERFSIRNLAALLSPAADSHLESMAQRSAALTRKRFGWALQFYTPLYVSNHCINTCVYCGFNCKNNVNRSTLSIDEAVNEAKFLAHEGFQHLLLVSGENPKEVPVEYFEELAGHLRGMFASLSIEIYPMSEDNYRKLVTAGVDSLTLYQETYNPNVYADFHLAGPKKDFKKRLDYLEDGAKAGITFLGIGALLGLTDWRTEAFYVGLHAAYLRKRYWRQHISVSFPRLRHAAGGFDVPSPVNDRALVTIICALRLQLPDAGLVLSTRETAEFRDNVLPLGITRVSAGSRTAPGGYASEEKGEEQFDVADQRSLSEVIKDVTKLGFDPVCKDWDSSYHSV